MFGYVSASPAAATSNIDAGYLGRRSKLRRRSDKTSLYGIRQFPCKGPRPQGSTAGPCSI